jgi:UDP-glucose 6-dehydrogenase
VSEVCKSEGIGYDALANLLGHQPWMGSHHFMVPGPDGEKGFGGPCLPKDTSAFMHHYDIKTLKAAMEVNEKCRH